MRWRALLGIALAGMVWLYGVYVAPGGGLDGPCQGPTAFLEGTRETSSSSSEWSWLPPGVRCVEERADGSTRERTYPEVVTFVVAAVALVLPATVRRRRTGRSDHARSTT